MTVDALLQPFLQRQRALVLDGALASELERRGFDLADPLWSARVLLEAPQAVVELHYDYFVAGADVATTASYQASFDGLMRRGLSWDEAAALFARSVELAQQARARFVAALPPGRLPPLVAASLGPYGAVLADGSEYRGDYALDEAALMDFHRPRLAALLAAAPDLIACETVPSQVEARALARLLAEEFPAARAWVGFSCRDGTHISDGTRLADCVALLDGVDNVVAIGVNCTAPRHVAALLSTAAAHTAKPLLAYPNSGEEYDGAARCWHGTRDAQGFADAARAWHAAGARLIGGCCRTGPDEIRAIAAWARAG